MDLPSNSFPNIQNTMLDTVLHFGVRKQYFYTPKLKSAF